METRPIDFVKLSGSGNDFVVVDNRDGRFSPLIADAAGVGRFARALCDRHMGIGADGVIFASRPEEGGAHVRASFLEADGTETMLCGNGVACLARWAIDNRLGPNGDVLIDTRAGAVYGEPRDGGYFRVCIPSPEQIAPGMEVHVDDLPIWCDYAVTGVPHLAVYVHDVAKADVARLGAVLRHHERFQPQGVNVNFVQVLRPGEIAVRTWEYGVEGETMACGTGSASAAILAARRFAWPAEIRNGDKPVLVHARGGDVLRVYFEELPDGTVDNVCVETVVRRLFSGTVSSDLVVRLTG
jgi:diaminopimelate epimerase